MLLCAHQANGTAAEGLTPDRSRLLAGMLLCAHQANGTAAEGLTLIGAGYWQACYCVHTRPMARLLRA